jgi:hypothetical protein
MANKGKTKVKSRPVVEMDDVGLGGEELSPEERVRLRKYQALLAERELAYANEENTALTWKAEARPFKERNREFFTTIGAMVILVSVILVFAGEFLAIAVVLSAAFMGYVLASVKPEIIEHQITTRGVRTGGMLYHWDTLGRFWFKEKLGQRMLMIETALVFPRHLLMVVEKKDEETMVKLLSRYLFYETPEPSTLDKWSTWLSEKVPLEGA